MKPITDIEIQAEKVSHILKAIAHPKKLTILCRLSTWPHTVGELMQGTQISPSQLSQFLSRMKQEWILDCQKSWLYVIYRISNPEILQLLSTLASLYCT